ncbi:MAG: DUF3488 and transglutaminase-like domain-containing protein [Candidatus Methylomirabilota bacterium]
MTVPRLSRITLYLLVLDAFGALYLTELLAVPALAGILLIALGSWWTEALVGHIPNYRRLWDTLTGIFLAYGLLDLTLLAESVIAALMHLLLFLLVYKLYNQRTPRDFLDAVILTFLMLIAAATLTVSFGFLLVFSVYMLLGVWALVLFHLRTETELAFPERGRELLEKPGLITGDFVASSVGLAVGALVLTLLIFTILPRVGRTFLPFRAQLGTMITGFSDRVELGVYGSIQNDPTIVMRIGFIDQVANQSRLPDLRWRGVAFDRFDGRGWALSDPARVPLRRTRDGAFAVAAHRIGAPFLAYEVFLEPIGSEAIFALPRLTALQARFPALAADMAGGLSLPAPPGGRVRYLAFSQPERFRPEQLDRPVRAADYPPEIRERYLQLPAIPARVAALARELAAPTPYQAARRVERYLEANIRYTLELRGDPSRDPIEEFLFVRQAGSCEYFATSMAVLLRAGGIPARVVNGFQRGEWNEVGQYYAVRQRDAHSWVEVYLPEAGWVTFDPSPRAAFEAAAFSGSGRLVQYFDALRMRWNRYVIDYSLSDQAALALGLRYRSYAFRRSVGQAWDHWTFRAASQARRLWRDHGPPAAAVLALLAAAGFLLRRRGALPEFPIGWRLGGGRRRRAVVFYERALRLLARKGHRCPPACTAREFAEGLAAGRELCELVGELTALYERVRFGAQPLTREEERRTADLLSRLAAALREESLPA